MNRIEVSAPGKLMLFGEHAVVYGYPCIVTAVDQRMRVWIKQEADDVIKIQAPDVNLTDYSLSVNQLGEKNDFPKGARFVLMAVKNFFDKYKVKSGLAISTRSDFSSEFGFGSSSAVTVAVIKGLSEIYGVKLEENDLFNLSYKTVLDIQGVGSGFDLAAAIWGGTLWFVAGGKTIIPFKIKELPVVVGYTGIKADTPTLIKQVAEERNKHPEISEKIFEAITLVVQKARNCLTQGNWQKLGELMNLNQGLLEALGVNTKELSLLIHACRGVGAFGAKLSGAGGGDCMITLVDGQVRAKVEEEIINAGGKVLKVKLNAEGVKNENDR